METHTAVEIHFRLRPAPRAPVHADRLYVPPPASIGRLPRVTQVLALALHFQDMVRTGRAKDYAALARLGGVTRERISQIMKLIWLAPDIQMEILYLPPTPGGRYPISECALRKIANLLGWPEQRSAWNHMKEAARLA